jgi:hypothetical protein
MGTGVLEVKRPVREAKHSPSSSAKVKNGGAIPPVPHVFMAWCLIRAGITLSFLPFIIIIIYLDYIINKFEEPG